MYTLFTDKSELFEADISVTGAALNESQCRLLLESDRWNLVFNGDIDRNGHVKIPIRQLKNILSEGDSGKLKLEVIVDDGYFSPWDSDFVIETQRKVTAEVYSSTKTKVISEQPVTVKIKNQRKLTSKSDKLHAIKLCKLFLTEKLDVYNISSYSSSRRIISKFLKENKIKNPDKFATLVSNILLRMSGNKR